MANIFNFDRAQVFASGPPKIPGGFDGELRITSVQLRNTQKAGLAFIAEFEVTHSNIPQAPVGSKLSYFQSLIDQTMAFNALLEFLVAAAGKDRNNETEIKEVQQVAGQIYEGVSVNAQQNWFTAGMRTVHVKGEGRISKKGFPYVKLVWTKAEGKAGPPPFATPAVAPSASPVQPTGPLPATSTAQQTPAQPQPQPQPQPAGGNPPWIR